MNKKFNVNSLGRKTGKTLVVIKSQDYFVGKKGPTYSYQLYNMFHGSNADKVTGAHITREEQILRGNGHSTVTFSVLMEKFSEKLLSLVNTDVPVHVIIDNYGVWHFTNK